MSSDNLENLARIGKLKREAPEEREFLGLLHSGRVRLADARLAGLSAESRFDLAYNAAHALAAGELLLRVDSMKPPEGKGGGD